MAEVVKKTVDEEVVDPATETEEEVSVSTYQQTIKKLVGLGNKCYRNVKVKNVNFTEKDNYTMVSFTLGSPVKGYASDDNGGTYKEGTTNIVYTSLFAIVGMLKEDEDKSWMANTVLANPNLLTLLFNGGTIDILQLRFEEGQPVVNPFGRSQNNDVVYDHDTIINHVVGFKFGKTGERMADKLADRLIAI